jgi:signal peptide peptidase SppA
VAVIRAVGPLMKFRSSLEAGTSTVQMRRQIRAAANDAMVNAILLHIDSPGGTVSGTYDLVEDIRRAAQQKPTWAYIEDLGASAAYAIAVATSKVFANPSGLVGSIGTYGVIQDISGWAEKVGLKVHVVKPADGTSTFKGTGVEGTEVTDEQIAEWTRVITDLNAFFLQTVSTGRKLSMAKTKELADGRVWIASEAKKKSLVDGVQSLDETLSQLSTRGLNHRRRNMSATLAELKAACPGANADFLVKQQENEATAEAASKAWMDELQLRLMATEEEQDKAIAEERAKREAAEKQATEAQQKATEAEEKAKQAAAQKPAGAQPVNSTTTGTSTTTDGTASERWQELVAGFEKAGKSRQQATIAAAKRDPQLHAEMVVEQNNARGRRKGAAQFAELRLA